MSCMQLIVLNPPTQSVSHKETRRLSSRFATFKLLTATLLLLFGCLLTGNLYAEPPECSMGACESFLGDDDIICFESKDSKCTARVLGDSITDSPGNWSDWEYVDGVECDNCCGDIPLDVSFSYQHRTGWSYCFTIGGDVEIKVPFGKWSIHAEGTVCHDRSTTQTKDVDFTCNPGSATDVTMMRKKKRIIITTRVNYSKWVEYGPKDPIPDGCNPDFETIRIDRNCGIVKHENDSYITKYKVVNQRIECETDDNGDIICPQ